MDGKFRVFDEIRGKWLVLNPEEWVRQHYVHFLISELGYSKGLISLEREITLNNTSMRYDIVVYDKDRNPEVIIECKAPNIKLDQSVLEQVLRYNLVLTVPYLVITNGMEDVVLHNSKIVKQLPKKNPTK
jgi:hypothetical protein